MTGVRLVATDLDGTLVRSDGTVSARTRAAVRAAQAAGIHVVAVTGRPPRWMAELADVFGAGHAVCANGAFVVDLETGEAVRSFPMAADVAAEVADALRTVVPDVVFAVERGQRFRHEAAYAPLWPTPGDAVVADLEELLEGPVNKLLARAGHLDADEFLDLAHGAVASLATVTHSSSDGLVEISAAGVTKASTLAVLCAELGVEPADTVAVGDMPNDLPMLEWAGRGIAVANAHSAVLAAADEVTASNDDDGVALVLERHLTATSPPPNR
ncbi:MAG TPA: HAD family hydrolase [Mycobacteriales bacterium]|nr:HAD family hydrolase [Mycobacteriales bacterium]